MKRSSLPGMCARRPTALYRQANSRLIPLILVCFALGAGVSAFWFYQRSAKLGGPASQAATPGLSESTLAVLRRLEVPIEIRFYSLLDPATVPDAVKSFAGRVSQLLAQYEQAGNGRIKVTRNESASNASANSALADGLQAFNQDKGEACYLGIALVHGDKKQSLPQLSPEWESALESDVSRAIARLNEAAAPPKPAAAPPIDLATAEEVKRALTNFDSMSVEEGTRLLRQAALTELAQTAQEMDARIKQAQQRFADAEKSQSAADQQAAHDQLVQLQAEQTQRLKQIIAKSQAQIEVLQRLKAGGQ